MPDLQDSIELAKKGRKKGRQGEKIQFADVTTGKLFDGKTTDVDKRWRDLLKHHLGVEANTDLGNVIWLDEADPLRGLPLKPGQTSPLCAQCKLDTLGCKNPYIEAVGSENPVITAIVERITGETDEFGELVTPSSAKNLSGANIIWRFMSEFGEEFGIDPSRDVRYLAITRCANRSSKLVDLSTRANWCRYHTVQDLRLHRPQMIMAFGSTVLGALSHKSNAFDWQGQLLTYRGWPDDWLMNPKFMKPRNHMTSDGSQIIGHPVFGPPPGPDARISLYPMTAYAQAVATQNQIVIDRWKEDFKKGLKLVQEGAAPKNYTMPWYNVVTEPSAVIEGLKWLIENPGTIISYDTETTGLKAYAKGAKIVFMMFRWCNAQGEPMSLGFPWEFPESPLYAHVKELTPWVLKALYASIIVGHNLTFDALFTDGTVEGCDIDRLAPQCKYDTWHMAYTAKQARGTLGLERLAYDHAPDLAGYEEDMTLLIQLEEDTMDPAAEKGGHYAMCPREKWDSHLVPYVMGDVETTYQSFVSLSDRLDTRRVYSIPLAEPGKPGKFRWFQTPSRSWVYDNIMSPASRMLIKVMARGMQIDIPVLRKFENDYPELILGLKQKLTEDFPEVAAWVEQKETTPVQEKGEPWEFDLENKTDMKDLLFTHLKMPIQRFTKQGQKIEDLATPESAALAPYELKLQYAAIDKFTLNKLAADYEIARRLLEYRKTYKLYTTYVRPLLNCQNPELDRKPRTKEPHLWLASEGGDDRLHASFMLTGTRGGRLSCRDPNLQQLPSDSSVKKMFVSRFGDGGCIYAGDLSQIELRLLAAACGDPNMLKAYYDNLDLHTLTTSRIFKLPYETFTKANMEDLQKRGKGEEAKKLDLQRRIGKTCNFLTGYGGGAFGLQTTLANSKIYMPIEECEDILNSFFESYPTLREYLSTYKDFIQKFQVAVSLFGRVRVLEEVRSNDSEQASKALRAGCNHLIQATASDMMLVCLCTIENAMRARGLRSILVSTVHDSLVIDAVREELDAVHEIVYTILNNIPDVLRYEFGDDFDLSWMIVPFAGDCEVGLNYKDANKIPMEGQPDWKELLKPQK